MRSNDPNASKRRVKEGSSAAQEVVASKLYCVSGPTRQASERRRSRLAGRRQVGSCISQEACLRYQGSYRAYRLTGGMVQATWHFEDADPGIQPDMDSLLSTQRRQPEVYFIYC